MNSEKTLEILRSIVETRYGAPTVYSAPEELSAALCQELSVEITAKEIVVAGSLIKLADMVETRLPRNAHGRSVVEIYAEVEQFVRDELSHEVNYHWHANWLGDLLRKTDSLEDVEIVIRMEESFGFSIPDRDAQEMRTVGQTVRYLWHRLSEESFTLRACPNDVCYGAFVFYELRRLLTIRGHISRADVQLDARLGDLLPSWHFQFWKRLPIIFGVDLPYGSLFSRTLGFEKRTTIRELVDLIAVQPLP